MPTDVIRKRINSIDAMRGIVIMLMLLDHVRERFFLHVPLSDPMNLDTTSEGLFFSRFVAHFCAPIFVFLTGVSAWLFSQSRQHCRKQTRDFLFKRGLFLILLEITVINFSWMGAYHTLWCQVIWIFGLCMLTLGCCLSLRRWQIATIGAVIVAGHNLLSPISFSPDQWQYPIWTILHDRGMLLESDVLNIRISYPVLPWIGVIFLGYAFGPVFGQYYPSKKRLKSLFKVGVSCLAMFALLRLSNIYGEPELWQQYDTGIKTLMSFLNLTKYPPSLNFVLLTVGSMMLGLYVLEKHEARANEWLATYGSAPMFFYILHLYVLLALYTIAVSIWGLNQGQYFGVDSIESIWLISAVLLVALYFPTKWFSQYKQRNKAPWLKYL